MAGGIISSAQGLQVDTVEKLCKLQEEESRGSGRQVLWLGGFQVCLLRSLEDVDGLTQEKFISLTNDFLTHLYSMEGMAAFTKDQGKSRFEETTFESSKVNQIPTSEVLEEGDLERLFTERGGIAEAEDLGSMSSEDVKLNQMTASEVLDVGELGRHQQSESEPAPCREEQKQSLDLAKNHEPPTTQADSRKNPHFSVGRTLEEMQEWVLKKTDELERFVTERTKMAERLGSFESKEIKSLTSEAQKQIAAVVLLNIRLTNLNSSMLRGSGLLSERRAVLARELTNGLASFKDSIGYRASRDLRVDDLVGNLEANIEELKEAVPQPVLRAQPGLFNQPPKDWLFGEEVERDSIAPRLVVRRDDESDSEVETDTHS